MLAEKIVIGCLLLGADIDTSLEPDMFTNDLYSDVYREYLRGYENHKEVTTATIEQALRSDQRPYLLNELAECVDAVATPEEIRANVEIIKKSWVAKRADEILNHFRPKESNIYTQIGEIIHQLEALQDNKATTSTPAADMVDKFKGLYFTDRPKGVQTGLDGLDDTLGDLVGGDVIVIGARPSVGKSAFVTQIATNIVKSGKRVGFYNLEMQDRQIYERLLASESGLSIKRIKRAVAFTGDEKAIFNKANEQIKSYKDLIVTTGTKKVSDIRSEARHMNYDIIIVDYMQLLLPEDRYRGNRFAEVGQISHELKALSMELNVPVVALSQLNRTTGDATREPTMAELRESGDVEQDASIIILMWNLTEDRATKGLKVDKNRQGKVGKEVLKFEGDTMRFIEQDEWQPAEDVPIFR